MYLPQKPLMIMTKAQKIFENETTDHAWPLTVRILVSSAILIYLFAVALPPLAGPPPASEIATVILGSFGISNHSSYRRT